jgi:hypothetical protein
MREALGSVAPATPAEADRAAPAFTGGLHAADRLPFDLVRKTALRTSRYRRQIIALDFAGLSCRWRGND